ncbi:flagellar hook-length control protein FliK [Lacticigenium naphthae]|uniref:flagellar hook-length control protein FliK n=1 Tax=Lacticigenium naphthae TaxID=515351 RepID=UPI0003FCC6DE|nr:flagellar hook-length control protein FliK [Lacticigenium naphthae]
MNTVQSMKQTVNVKTVKIPQKNQTEKLETFEAFLHGLMKESEVVGNGLTEEGKLSPEEEQEILQLLNLLFTQSEGTDGDFLGELKEMLSKDQQVLLQKLFPEHDRNASIDTETSIPLTELFTPEEMTEVKALLSQVKEAVVDRFQGLPIEQVEEKLALLGDQLKKPATVDEIKQIITSLVETEERLSTIEIENTKEMSVMIKEPTQNLAVLFRNFKAQIDASAKGAENVQADESSEATHPILETVQNVEGVEQPTNTEVIEQTVPTILPHAGSLKEVEELGKETDGKKVSSIEEGARFAVSSKINPEAATPKTTQSIATAFKETMTVNELVTAQEKLVVDSLVRSGEKMTAKIQLTPQHLGKVSVEIEMIDELLTLKWVVENSETKHILDQQFNHFKQDMASQKIAVNSFSVDVQTGQDQSQQQSSLFQQEQDLKLNRSGMEETEEVIQDREETDSTGVSLLI